MYLISIAAMKYIARFYLKISKYFKVVKKKHEHQFLMLMFFRVYAYDNGFYKRVISP